MRVEVFRLEPGEDLRVVLERWVNLQPEDAFDGAYVITGIGSFTRAVLRYADRDEGKLIEGPLELVSLAGTLAEGGVHLHACVANAFGETIGGHLLHGCIVRTTAEIVLGLLPGAWQIKREMDAATGYKELVVRKT